MNVSSCVQDFSFLSVPFTLWNYYLEYLWYYDSSSWVARISSTIRVLAFLVVLPVAIIGMLDISSYVVARTLGVVDVSKASTTEKPVVSRLVIPSIRIEDTSSSSSPLAESATSTADVTPPDLSEDDSNGLADLSGLDDSLFSNERLSGVGVFSPATSRPSSPILSRRRPIRESKSLGGKMDEGPEVSLRRRPRGTTHSGTQDDEA